MNVDELFVNLNVLSYVKPHSRINTSTSVIYIEGSCSRLPVFVRRFISGDSRIETLRKLHEIVTATALFLSEKRASLNQFQKQKIIMLLPEAKKGVENLLKTYSNDITTISRLKYILTLFDEIVIVESKSVKDKKTKDI